MPDCLVCFEPRPAASVSLVCIPWAGAGAAPFHAWTPVCEPAVELFAVRRAGRERRLREPPMDRMADVVAEIADSLNDSRPIILFGHCVGGLIAFELARELRARGSRQVKRLVILGTPAPGAWKPPDDEGDLTAQLRREGITDEQLLDNTPIFNLLRPSIEADFRLARNYHYRPAEPLDVPITVLGTEEPPPGWEAESNAGVAIQVVPQGSWLELAEAVARIARGES